MKASITISVMFFLFTTCSSATEDGVILQKTDVDYVGVSTDFNKAVLDMGGNPIEWTNKCVMRARKPEITEDLLTVFKGSPFVQLHKDYLSGGYVAFHPKAAADQNVYLTTLTPYGIKFKSSDKFWKLDGGLYISQTGANISDSGTFTMEEINDTEESYQVYKLVYYPGAYDVGMYFTGSEYKMVALVNKSHTRLLFGFNNCHA